MISSQLAGFSLGFQDNFLFGGGVTKITKNHSWQRGMIPPLYFIPPFWYPPPLKYTSSPPFQQRIFIGFSSDM